MYRARHVPVDPAQVFAGSRRPAVDTFLVFLNLVNGDTKLAPVGIVDRFGINGETVDEPTFHARLPGTTRTATDVDRVTFTVQP